MIESGSMLTELDQNTTLEQLQPHIVMDSSYTPNPAAIRTAMDALQTGYNDLMSSSQEDLDAARLATIAKARDFIASLETPLESIIWMAWAEVWFPPPPVHHPLFLTQKLLSPPGLLQRGLPLTLLCLNTYLQMRESQRQKNSLPSRRVRTPT